ncbi:AMP-binding protein [Plantactinospora solaniradicis]|uniref:AMP-binding protein n=1 Tax=Plantactinospora solaniradicis TaxID=1723736 RepID=A0ABW1K0F2_9ACTN
MQDGASTPAQPPAVTLADRVRLAATTRGGQTALVWPDGTMDWAELDRAVDRVADALRRRAPGPSAGHPARIAIALANSPDFAVAFFGIQRAGLVAVPVNPALTGPELRHILADSGAAILICTEQVRATIAGIAAELPALVEVHTTLPTAPDPASGSTRVPAEPADPPIGTDAEAVAVLLYTSGTTGAPKGAMLSHRALLANHEQIDRIEPSVVGPDDRVLLALPLFHAYGLNAGLGAVAYHGACGVLVDRFDADAVLAVVAGQRVSVLVGVPSMFLGWVLLPDAPAAAGVPVGSALRTAMASVRVAICGAAPLAVGGAARFAEATGRQIQVGYGLTETAPVLTSTLAGPAAKPGSIGRPIPGVELRLVGRDDEVLWRDGSTVDPGDNGDNEDDGDELDLEFSSPGTDPGEIVVRGANLFSGYWPDGQDGPDADGWWRTGDIAYADVDSDLFLVDRLGELILVNGFNVYPQEVERVLGGHPEVAESAVLGVPHPLAGEAVVAYVVRAPGGTVSAADLSRHCAASLARFKCPSRIEFVESLPLSAIGRVRRSILRKSGGSGDE